jgi:hypothetical protein
VPYLGNDLQVAQPSYRNIDDISGSFNSSTTSFPLLVSGAAPVPFPINSNQCLISVAGVVQRPDDSGTEGFRISGGNIIFSSAPSTGADFFGVILAGADYVNVGANFPSGSAAVPSITFDSDLDTGIYNSAANQVSITTAGTERLRIDSAGQIEAVSLGTAAAPSFSFTTDPNTGIYSPGADQVAISTNGTGRLFVDASGKVGINISSPDGTTHVHTATAGAVTANTSADDLVVENSGAGGISILTPDANNGSIFFGTPSDAAGAAIRWNYSTGEFGIGPDKVGGYLRFNSDDGTERMRLDSSGRLLVGTSTATNNLRLDEKFAIVGTTANYPGMAITGYTGGAGGTDYSPLIELKRSRGTTDGSFTKVESGDALGKIMFLGADGSSWAAGAYIEAFVDGATSAGDLPTRLVFSTCADGASSPTERMRINNLGALKATTTGSVITSASSTHEFTNGNASEEYAVRIRQSSASGNLYPLLVEMSAQAPNNATSVFINCGDSGTTRLALRSNGGLANYSANNVNLSDINTKKDISPAADTWDCLKQWEIVNFRYKDQPDNADLNMGVIAQQVAESCPEVITVFQEAKEATDTEPAQEERLGVKDQQMMWMAIKALQEAQIRIENLEAEVAALKGA